jgi:hypothetical protein
MLRYWLNKIPQVADIEKRNFDKAAPTQLHKLGPLSRWRKTGAVSVGRMSLRAALD